MYQPVSAANRETVMLGLLHVNGRNAGWGPGREAGRGRDASLQWICSLGVMVPGQPPHSGHTVCCARPPHYLAVGPPDVLLPALPRTTTATIYHLTNGARMSGQIKGKPLDICHFWSENLSKRRNSWSYGIVWPVFLLYIDDPPNKWRNGIF